MFNHKHYVYGDQNVTIPAHLNFGKYVLNHIRSKKDQVALINGETNDKLTYKDLTRYAVNLAVALKRLGVGVGDTVAVGWEKRIDLIPTMLGIIFTGATYTAYDVNTGFAFLKQYLNISKPKYLITSNLFWDTYKDVLNLECIENIIRIDDSEKSMINVGALYAKNSENVDFFEPSNVQGQSDVAVIMYSSGTTGMPKGVQLTHVSCICFTLSHGIEDGLINTVFITGDWYHSYGLFSTVHWWLEGKTVVYVDEMMYFPKSIQNYQVDLAIVGQSGVYILSKSEYLENLNIDSLKIMYSAGAPVHAKTIEKIRKRLPELKFCQRYGMTETGAITSECWRDQRSKGSKLGSVGVAVPGCIVKVVDLKTRDILGPFQKGEICVKGPALMKGYIGIDISAYFDDDGFYHSGDVGYYDDDEYFFLLDRLKDIIMYGSYNIWPMELETILQEHPGVKDVGVVGKPVPGFGEEPTAFVVRQPGSETTEQELIDFVSVKVPPFMHLKGGVKFLEKLPRNITGKIQRRQLQETLNAS